MWRGLGNKKVIIERSGAEADGIGRLLELGSVKF